MSRTESSMVELGTVAPDFSLTDALTGRTVHLRDLMAAVSPSPKSGLLIMFVCVHCPYVKHVEGELARIGRDYFGEHGEGPIAIAAIQSNDTAQYPEDAPEHMREQAARLGWTFPYLIDDTQQVARAYDAACTPDFFLFDANLQLVYRGQLDASRPPRRSIPGDTGNGIPVTGSDLRAALDNLIAGQPPLPDQHSSIGCNIKWRNAATTNH